MSDALEKAIPEKISSLTEELWSALVERATLRAGLEKMTLLVLRKMEDVVNLLSSVSKEV